MIRLWSQVVIAGTALLWALLCDTFYRLNTNSGDKKEQEDVAWFWGILIETNPVPSRLDYKSLAICQRYAIITAT